MIVEAGSETRQKVDAELVSQLVVLVNSTGFYRSLARFPIRARWLLLVSFLPSRLVSLSSFG